MKLHLNPDKEIVNVVCKGLRENEGYCPCIYESKGKPEYKCPCQDFRENVQIGQVCHCGLYIKDEM